jgi:hypothetical protein
VVTVISTLAIVSVGASQKMLDSLVSLKRVSFDYKRICDYRSSEYHHVLSTKMHVEFGNYDLVNARFVATMGDTVTAYNGKTLWNRTGKESWDGKKNWKSSGSALKDGLNGTSTLYNNLLGLQKHLATVVSDHCGTITDTGADTFVLQLNKRRLFPVEMDVVEFSPVYKFQLDPKTHLPIKISQTWGDGKDTIVTVFTHWSLNPPALASKDWNP